MSLTFAAATVKNARHAANSFSGLASKRKTTVV